MLKHFSCLKYKKFYVVHINELTVIFKSKKIIIEVFKKIYPKLNICSKTPISKILYVIQKFYFI